MKDDYAILAKGKRWRITNKKTSDLLKSARTLSH